ncbi:hypothetical protein PIB30_058398 [Stylosanthes scabra]|uniref:DUF4378 domain-containing protein n=1 Tax=Stylosanthes scabra TaxID=79078 RepID=A0ABU6RJV3_9FABA|nr:hypothetical protein [Stylosanthes scabra]
MAAKISSSTSLPSYPTVTTLSTKSIASNTPSPSRQSQDKGPGDEIPVTLDEKPEIPHGPSRSSTRISSSNVDHHHKLKSSPGSKHSIKSRLKSLIQDELYRKKGEHKRSSTCPTSKSQLIRADSVHHLDVTSDNNQKCVDCGAEFSHDNVEMSNIHKHVCSPHQSHQGARNQKIKSMNAKILTTDASPHLFKDFLDALDLMSKNKDSILKYIQDPEGSTLIPSGENDKQDSRSNKPSKRSNSVSFPLPDSSSSKDSKKKPLKMDEKVERQLQAENNRRNKSMSKSSSETSPQHSPPDVPSKAKSKRYFFDLKKKIMQIIEENKKEKHRIAMDAIVDKIPQGNKHSKLSKKYTHDPLSKDPAATDIEGKESSTKGGGYGRCLSSSSFNKRQPSTIRTASLKESAGKYSQLYETCFNTDSKANENIKLKEEEKSSCVLMSQNTFQRFLSLPHNIAVNSEDSSLFLSFQSSFRQRNRESLLRSFKKACDSNSEALLQALEDDAIQESILSALEPKRTLVRSQSRSEADANNVSDCASCSDEMVTGHGTESNQMLGEANSVFSCDTNFLEDTFEFDNLNLLDGELFFDTELDQKDEVGRGDNTQKLKTISKNSSYYKIPCIEVDPSHESAFNYVRKVLELSGFTSSSDESLEMWYSDSQPVNPSVYEELEGCLLLDPAADCDDGHYYCNHLLLFDIVNEGLLDIFGRSYSYYPRSLSSLSHVHPLPVGEDVVRKVWALLSWYLRSTSEPYPTLDYYVSRDLAKDDGWMNLQFDSECVALELDDLIFDDLLEEIIKI